jgi:hypothetical protein
MFGNPLGILILGAVWICMVISLEIFTDLNDGLDCGSVLSCGELVKGDFHMGKVSGMSYMGIAQKMF